MGTDAVDLISQQKLAKQWRGVKTEFHRASVVDVDAGEVSRQKITGKADALEVEG